MTKEELIKRINNIIEFITDGKVQRNGRIFKEHPAFFLIHTKDEFEKNCPQL